MTEKVIFENEQWILKDWGIEEKEGDNLTPYYIESGLIENYPAEQFTRVLSKTWVVPRLWKEVYLVAIDYFKLDFDIGYHGFRDWIDSQVKFEKELRKLNNDVRSKLGTSSSSIKAYKDAKDMILKESPELYPLITKAHGGKK